MTIALGVHASAAATTAGLTVVTPTRTSAATGSTFSVGVGWFTAAGAGAAPTITDSKLNTYTQVGSTLQSAGTPNLRFAVFESVNGTGGTLHTCTATFGANQDVISIWFNEITGGLTSGIRDQAPAGNDDTASPYTSTTTGTTSQANELLITYGGTLSSSGTETITWSNSFASNGDDRTNANAEFTGSCATRVVSATGAYQSSFTSAGAGTTEALVFIVTYKDITAGGGGATPPSVISAPSTRSAVEAVVRPLLFAGAVPFQGFVQTGINEAFLPDTVLSATGPSLFTGVAPAGAQVRASIIQDAPFGSATIDVPALPPRPLVVAGSGQAAQPAVVVYDPWFGSATFDQVLPPPQPRLAAGSGQAAQKPVILQDPIIGSAVFETPLLPPNSAVFAGFGQAAQRAVVFQDPAFGSAVFDAVPLPPAPELIAGFGAAAQVAAVFRAPATELTRVPPTPLLSAGFGPAAQPPVTIVAPAFPPRADLFLVPTMFAGAGLPPALPVPIIFAAPQTAPRVELPPQITVRAGAGQAAQPPVLVTAPVVATSVDLFLTGRLIAGFGQPPSPPPPIIASAPQTAPGAPLPPLALVIRGAGQAAQPPVVVTAPLTVPVTDLFVRDQTFAGFGQTAQPAPPFVGAAVSAFAPGALPPASSVLAGFGQAAQPAVVYSAPRLPELAAGPPLDSLRAGVPLPLPAFIALATTVQTATLPPATAIIAGAGQAPVVPVGTIASASPVTAVLLPPFPVLIRGFGQAAQPPAIFSATLEPPRAALPPQSALFVGVVIPPAAFVFSAPTIRSADLPPATRIAAGFGVAAQNAVIITVPFSTTGITLLPPGTSIFAGFGTAGIPFLSAPFSRSSPVFDVSGIGRQSRIFDEST